MNEPCERLPLCSVVVSANEAIRIANQRIEEDENMLLNGPDGRDWRPGEKAGVQDHRKTLKENVANIQDNIAGITIVSLCATCPLR